jgi:hypothetical protein
MYAKSLMASHHHATPHHTLTTCRGKGGKAAQDKARTIARSNENCFRTTVSFVPDLDLPYAPRPVSVSGRGPLFVLDRCLEL